MKRRSGVQEQPTMNRKKAQRDVARQADLMGTEQIANNK